jgi:hypothetical protein
LQAAESVSGLPEEALEDLERCLREEEYFTDQERVASIQQTKLSELDDDIYQAVRDDLLRGLEAKLGSKLIGELPPYLQQMIRGYLRGTDYFVDEDKLAQADSLTLSTLDASTLRDLEQRVGNQIVASFEQRKFMNLDQEVRESILHYLDLEGLFRKRKKREQFVKGSLADLDQGIKDGVAYHLGRQHLAELREVTLVNLPDDLRQEIWAHLRSTGYFVDAEKEEYLEIEELKDFDPELRRGLVAAVEQGVEKLLSKSVLADLPDELQAGILQRLEQKEYFLDAERLARFRAAPASDLEPEAYATACRHLGRRILAGLEHQRVSDLSGDLRHEVEAYLAGSDYFVDQAKEDKFMQRRIADLGDDVLEGLTQRLGRQLELETMESSVAALDKNDRECLRDYLDSVGHFLDEEAVARFELGLLTDLGLDTREYEALASSLGQKWVEENGDRKLSELEQQLQEEIARSLRSSDYFLDRDKLQRFHENGVAELDQKMREAVVRHVAQTQAQEIAERRFEDLDEQTRHEVERFLASAGFGLNDEGMEEFEGRQLADLDEELAEGLARYLGHQRLMELGDARIADLDEQSRSEVERFLGEELMHRIEKQLMLGFTSKLWVDYLTAIEDLRQGIGLQAYGQMDPLVEYKRRAFRMFGELNDNINRMVVGSVFRYPPQPLRLAQAGQR